MVEILESALEMEVDVEGKGEKGGEGTLRALGSIKFLTQDVEPIGTMLVDAHNGFNDMSRLTMLWMVRHRWMAGARFTLKIYRHWEQPLIFHLVEPPVTILSQ